MAPPAPPAAGPAAQHDDVMPDISTGPRARKASAKGRPAPPRPDRAQPLQTRASMADGAPLCTSAPLIKIQSDSYRRLKDDY